MPYSLNSGVYSFVICLLLESGDMTIVSKCLMDHRITYPARKPKFRNLPHQDEFKRISTSEGLLELDFPPDGSLVIGSCPTSRQKAFDVNSGSNRSKYLWVVAIEGVPTALENTEDRVALKQGRLTHTNLTGGEKAHTGGELWFLGENKIIINGGSFRYEAENAEQLRSVAESFKTAGYKVANMGWDEEGGFVRFLRGDPEWI